MKPEALLTLRDLVDLFKLSEKSVYRLAQAGRIPGFKVGSSWRFRPRDIEAWMEAQVRGSRSNAKKGARRGAP